MSKTQRRTQAERSEETRGKVAKAAYEVIAERGHSASHGGGHRASRRLARSDAASLSNQEIADAGRDPLCADLGRDKSMKRANGAGDDIRATLLAMAEDFRAFFLGNQFWVSLDITMDAAKDASMAPEIRAIVSRSAQAGLRSLDTVLGPLRLDQRPRTQRRHLNRRTHLRLRHPHALE